MESAQDCKKRSKHQDDETEDLGKREKEALFHSWKNLSTQACSPLQASFPLSSLSVTCQLNNDPSGNGHYQQNIQSQRISESSQCDSFASTRINHANSCMRSFPGAFAVPPSSSNREATRHLLHWSGSCTPSMNTDEDFKLKEGQEEADVQNENNPSHNFTAHVCQVQDEIQLQESIVQAEVQSEPTELQTTQLPRYKRPLNQIIFAGTVMFFGVALVVFIVLQLQAALAISTLSPLSSCSPNSESVSPTRYPSIVSTTTHLTSVSHMSYNSIVHSQEPTLGRVPHQSIPNLTSFTFLHAPSPTEHSTDKPGADRSSLEPSLFGNSLPTRALILTKRPTSLHENAMLFPTNFEPSIGHLPWSNRPSELPSNLVTSNKSMDSPSSELTLFPNSVRTDAPTRSPLNYIPNDPDQGFTFKPTTVGASATDDPTESPTDLVTNYRTESPTDIVKDKPTKSPIDMPIDIVTDELTESPIKIATVEPTESPIDIVTDQPTESPIDSTTDEPTECPIDIATDEPTKSPIDMATNEPTESPIDIDTDKPTE